MFHERVSWVLRLGEQRLREPGVQDVVSRPQANVWGSLKHLPGYPLNRKPYQLNTQVFYFPPNGNY
jgi:hypothetical protein